MITINSKSYCGVKVGYFETKDNIKIRNNDLVVPKHLFVIYPETELSIVYAHQLRDNNNFEMNGIVISVDKRIKPHLKMVPILHLFNDICSNHKAVTRNKIFSLVCNIIRSHLGTCYMTVSCNNVLKHYGKFTLFEAKTYNDELLILSKRPSYNQHLCSEYAFITNWDEGTFIIKDDLSINKLNSVLDKMYKFETICVNPYTIEAYEIWRKYCKIFKKQNNKRLII